MRIASIIARILFGIVFTLAGALGIYFDLFTSGPPSMPGTLGDFTAAVYHSHFILLPSFVQVLTGIAFLSNRYVPLALMATAGVLVNILTVHITMQPLGIFPGLILCVCWVLIALPLRDKLLPLLSAKA